MLHSRANCFGFEIKRPSTFSVFEFGMGNVPLGTEAGVESPQGGDDLADQSDCRYAVAEDDLSFLQVFVHIVPCLLSQARHQLARQSMITIGRSYAWY